MFVFRKCTPLGKKKPEGAQQVLDRLNGYLDAASPAPVYWLTRLWEDQQQAVTYQELRQAILTGGMDPAAIQAWQEDYAVFVNEHLKDTWVQALTEGAAHVARQHPDFFFDPLAGAVQSWSAEHGAQWVTLVSDEQRSALASLIGQGASGAFGVDELSRAIRPLIGLTKPQAQANLRYYQHMRDYLLEQNPTMRKVTAEKRAREKTMVYAARQHRRRAYNIAVTELAYAYCKGADEAVVQAMEQGYMGKTVRVWSTAADEGVCPVCGGLEGAAIEMDQEFTFPGKSLYGGQKRTPPAHPGCRCAVEYRELEPPAWRGGEKVLSGREKTDIMGMYSGSAGDSDGYTTITEAADFDYSDADGVRLALARFAEKYRGAGEEHALVLSPLGRALHLKGETVAVNTRLAGQDALKGSVVIHNHPVVDGYADAFSREDFRELFWGQVAESWVVSGSSLYRMSYTGPPITPAEAVKLYMGAFQRVRKRAAETMVPIELEQLETMRELAQTLEGLRFDEFSI